MEIPLTQRLSFKQAAITVIVAFIIGTLLSLIQIAFDYLTEDALIDREIEALMEITQAPASRIAYNIDVELAKELVAGLLHSPAVIGARIIDSDGKPLAAGSHQAQQDYHRVLSDFLFGNSRHFESKLSIEQAPEENLGVLQLDIDTYAFGSRFINRGLVTLANGFVRSLLLSSILLVLFYFMLSKPLAQIIKAVSKRDMRSPNHPPLRCPLGHEHDEIGILVSACNRQLDSIAMEIEQRRNAEQCLTGYLSDLEAIVNARTREIKEANTHLKRSNQELEQARRNAVNMAQARTSFLANMSHEIRTPLNGLLGMLALSLESPLSNEQRQQLTIAHDSGKIIVGLLNDILDLSKFEAGQLELESIEFDLGTLVENTASLLSQSAAPEVELTCLIDPQLPARLKGDPNRIRQVVSNLLSNALKFTRTGRVDISVSSHRGKVRISVSDTGIGIAEDAQLRIFQPFTQAAADISRQFGGTGLGLTLAHYLCEIMRGKLHLTSRLGTGSNFTAELPLTEATPVAAAERINARVIALCAAATGLAELLQTQASLWGFAYQRMDDALQAAKVDADLLIIDQPLYATMLRSLTDTPIILVTTYGNFIANEQAAALAPLEQLARPLSRQTLLQAFKNSLHKEASAENPTHNCSALQQQQRRVLLVEDNVVNQLVAKGMLNKQGIEVIVAINGYQALQRLEELTPDLILMDCNMPVMDGYEASRHIRNDPRWQHLPIIALTANALAEERKRCLGAGMNDYLAKPFRREELLALLEQWLTVAAKPNIEESQPQ